MGVMGTPDPFRARVTKRPPRPRDTVAPERDVLTGQYRRGVDREDKHRRPDQEHARRTRRPRRVRPRRLHAWQAAAGCAAAAVAVVVLVATGDDAPRSAPPATERAAGDVASGTTDDAAGTGTANEQRPLTTGVVPATAAVVVTSTTMAATTSVTIVPTSSPMPVDVANGIAGEYALTMAITDGNENLPVGTSRDVVISLVADCAGPRCTVSSPDYGGASWSFDGSVFATTLTVPEACPGDPGRTVDTIVHVSLQVIGRDDDGLPTGLSGTQTNSTPGAAGCENATNDPVTWSITATRVG